MEEDETKHRDSCCWLVSKAFMSEMKCRNFFFSGGIYALFPFPTWMWMDLIYSIYRFIIAIGLLVWMCVEIPLKLKYSQSSRTRFNYFLFATNWGFMTFTFSSLLFAVIAIYYACNKGFRVNKWIAMVLWFFYSTALNLVMVTCSVYWVALADPKFPDMIDWASKLKHSLPLLLVILDLLINGLQIRIFHFIYPMILGIIYAIFSYLYFRFVDIDPIYPVLDWSMVPKSIGVSVITILVTILMQLIMFMIFVGRTLLSYKLNGRGKYVVSTWNGEPSVDYIFEEEVVAQFRVQA